MLHGRARGQQSGKCGTTSAEFTRTTVLAIGITEALGLIDNLSIIDVLSIFVLQDPLSNDAAKRLIAQILTSGDVRFSDHALKEMEKDGLTTVDVANVLRGGT